ncbi:GLPGLI family protein [Winogradskyella aquimaris]|uniref:GLPGLI family protein n=1 Tax=Winogradskyella aquimaris TaxID=864074 RepID=A0ABU5EIR3_9FLAO|nr:GLPGLI family protein [Winogradskyella aquimaris]MDY2585761.1 GLPGLI family protein [Winogradskyella aquimaris]
MKSLLLKFSFVIFLICLGFHQETNTTVDSYSNSNEFQGQAFYVSKSKMELGRWGARLSEAQKKQIEARLKNRLEKEYILTFNKAEAIFYEDEKLDAMSGATDSWGKNFSPGKQYKNVKTNTQIQSQEFYGKKFLVKDKLQDIDWKLGKETKQIGNYMCFKATASIPTSELAWYDFSWSRLRNSDNANETESDSTSTSNETPEIEMTEVEAWYSPQIPVGHGPLEYWGLPGLILEVSAGNTIMLCTKIVLNPKEKLEITAPDKGKEITKAEYQNTIVAKMKEFRNNRMGRRRG